MDPMGVVGLIGYPIDHSRSPQIMNRAIQEYSLPYVYLGVNVHPAHLRNTIQGLRNLSIKGWNVTAPHKISVMHLLDGLSQNAQRTGAVNTVVAHNGKLQGYNTDGLGYLYSLEEEMDIDFAKQHVVILGAGGAAKAVGYALVEKGIKSLTIANRTLEKAKQLANYLNTWVPCKMVPLDHCQREIAEASLLINTTPVGMFPFIDVIPIKANWLHADLIVSDLVYNPMKTSLLEEAACKGAKIHSGLGMLVHQAALSFELWFGIRPNTSMLKRVLTNH